MPAISIKTSTSLNAATKETIKQALGQAIALIPHKSEKWLMVLFEDVQDIFMGGEKDDPAAFIEVSLFGSASKEFYDALTKKITTIFTERAGIMATRIYINYAETPFWGWNGKNF